ncbi:hypothetical protein QBC40DRAFT_330951 [Triangularia verruculosa]|uniref:Uncharacterized protein n=1 Tax=Triangularia verruculosa TaxID=2587418 RepID=A0AAN6XSB7_9PEZI|nr:hypothetical protein QBC40DRAFT_330951 [Triangularia verruculosa]
MPHHIPWEVKVKSHPGSSKSETHSEPDWTKRRSGSIGFKNRDGGRTDITHPDHDHEHDHEHDHDPGVDREAEEKEHAREIADACWMRSEPRQKIDGWELVNFRDVIKHQYSFHLKHPENRSLAWRYVLETTEDWIKEKEPWPANLAKKQPQEKAHEGKDTVKVASTGHGPDEEAWRRKAGGTEPNLTPPERTLLVDVIPPWRRYMGSEGRGVGV